MGKTKYDDETLIKNLKIESFEGKFNYYRLQAKLNICVKYTVHKTQLAENKNREIKNKLRAKLRMKKNF
jgi:hypothetical protein